MTLRDFIGKHDVVRKYWENLPLTPAEEATAKRLLLKYNFGKNVVDLQSSLVGAGFSKAIDLSEVDVSEIVHFLPSALEIIDGDIDLTGYANPAILYPRENGTATFAPSLRESVSTLIRDFRKGKLGKVDRYSLEQVGRIYEAAGHVLGRKILYGRPV